MHNGKMIKSLLIVLMVFMGLMVSCTTAKKSASNTQISHVVIIWLNDGLSEEQVSKVIKQTNVLSKISVVQDLKIGRPVASERKTVDDSFTFAISMNFENDKALKQYMEDHTHHEYVKSVLKPALKKVVIYDYK